MKARISSRHLLRMSPAHSVTAALFNQPGFDDNPFDQRHSRKAAIYALYASRTSNKSQKPTSNPMIWPPLPYPAKMLSTNETTLMSRA